MADAHAQPADEVIHQGTYTTDATYADRLARDSFRFRLKHGFAGQVIGVLLTAGVVVVFMRPPDLRVGILATIVAITVSALVTVAFMGWSYWSQRRKLRDLIPAGSTYAVTVRQTAMSIRDWMIASENNYGLWSSAEIVGDHVIFRRRGSAVYTPLPRELFTPDVERWLIMRIGDQRP